jgi:predicted nucleic acid-binding protein
MSALIDTSVLIRTLHAGNPLQTIALQSLAKLRAQGETLCVVPQNLIEFWAVATRPTSANSLGLSVEEAGKEIAQIKRHFILKPETKSLFNTWERIVTSYRVSGKQAHDARIVAAMQTHKINRLLTFNVADFQRYSPLISHYRRYSPQSLNRLLAGLLLI